MSMEHERRAVGCWWLVLVCALLAAALFCYMFFLPYANHKAFLDSLAGDGDFESFSNQVYSIWRFLVLFNAVLSIAVLVILIGFRSQSLTKINQFIPWFKSFLQQRRSEIAEIAQSLKPSRHDLLPLASLAVIMIFGLISRYVYLWRPMSHDETYTFVAFAERGLRTVITDYHLPNNHVLHTILVNLSYQVFGDSPAAIRLPAFIAGLLVIPATYLVACAFYDRSIGFVAASLVAALPVMIDYSTDARGYTMIALFALLMVAIAVFIKDHVNLVGWVVLVLIASLGLYTNPTMMYPIGMAFTWLFISGLIGDVHPGHGKKLFVILMVSGVGVILLALILYLPIIYTSGLQSIIGNNVVETLSWSNFSQSIEPRIRNTWQEWNRGLHPIFSWLGLIGLAASFFVPRLPRNRRIPLVFAGFLWIAAALLVQRVAPWPRIWLFLLPFFAIWILAGYVGMLSVLFARISNADTVRKISIGIFVIVPLCFGAYRAYIQYVEKWSTQGEVEKAAVFLESILQDGDTVAAISPDRIILEYYLGRRDISGDAFQVSDLDANSRVIVVVNQAMNQNMANILQQNEALDDVDMSSAEKIYQTRRFILYRLASR